MEQINLKEMVISDYSRIIKAAEAIQVDEDYAAPFAPSRMQRLMVVMLKERQFYNNWSGTGAGKTVSALLSGRLLGCRNMVVVCPNDVKTSWESAIASTYPTNSKVINVSSIKDIEKFDRRVFNYIIINYDKFSIDSINGGKNMVNTLLNLNQIDFICFDEIHFVKSVNQTEASKRRECVTYLRKKAYEMNNKLYCLGMTATPVINNPYEVRSIVDLVSGKEHEEITKNKKSISNLARTSAVLFNTGIRYVKDYGIKQNNKVIRVDGSKYIQETIDCASKRDYMLRLEKLNMEIKMNDPNVLKEIKKGTILFSYYRDTNNDNAIIRTITDKLEEMGLSYAIYAGGDGGRNSGKEMFCQGKVDVLVATKPISTGVDGLQKRSNRIIMLGYPWTGAEYDQLIGRIDRQGSVFSEISIIHPWVEIPVNDKKYSYDAIRYHKITSKKNLSNALMEGNFNHICDVDEKEIAKRYIEMVKEASDYTPNREEL